MQLFYYFFSLFYVGSFIATEYIYPVAAFNNNLILYMHQNSSYTIQLFERNIITNTYEQALWSLFNPINVQILPNNKEFSFIDNGRLRIKRLEKRSPKTIDFDLPIFHINGLHWCDEYTCYCSAQYDNRFLLFELQVDGRVTCLLSHEDKDCLYPQKVNNQLFYIEREKENDCRYRIMQTIYNTKSCSQDIISFDDASIIFLHMIAETEGFVMGYKKNTEEEELVQFFYYHLLCKEKTWQKQLLFSFMIPSYLFLENNEARLFESILPLLPRVIHNKIYFVDASDNMNKFLELYYYDFATMTRSKIEITTRGHCFVPIKCGEYLYYGGSKDVGGTYPFF